jgi:hypothetical protein
VDAHLSRACCCFDRSCATGDAAAINLAAGPRHLLFTFSGNAPDALLTASLQAYPGPINQWGIGLRVEGHVAFIGAVYDRVIANANNP